MNLGKDFYVYRIFHEDTLLYIGKGSGKRLSDQKRAFGVNGEVIAYFDTEEQAYAEEIRLIAAHEPLLNKHPGGMGGRVSVEAPLPHGFSDEGLPYAAKQLARLLLIWKREPELSGILNILGAYIKAHGLAKVERGVLPHLKRLMDNDIAIENKA